MPPVSIMQIIDKIQTGEIDSYTEIKITAEGEYRKADSIDFLKPHFKSEAIFSESVNAIINETKEGVNNEKEKNVKNYIFTLYPIFKYHSVISFVFAISVLVTLFLPLQPHTESLVTLFLDDLFTNSKSEIFGYSLTIIFIIPILLIIASLKLQYWRVSAVSLVPSIILIVFSFYISLNIENVFKLDFFSGNFYWLLFGILGVSISIDAVFDILFLNYYWDYERKIRYFLQLAITFFLIMIYQW